MHNRCPDIIIFFIAYKTNLDIGVAKNGINKDCTPNIGTHAIDNSSDSQKQRQKSQENIFDSKAGAHIITYCLIEVSFLISNLLIKRTTNAVSRAITIASKSNIPHSYKVPHIPLWQNRDASYTDWTSPAV